MIPDALTTATNPIEVAAGRTSELCTRAGDPADDSGAGRYAHLHHHQAKKGLHRVRADLHLVSDFFAGESFPQILHGLLLANREAEALGHFIELGNLIASPFQHHN